MNNIKIGTIKGRHPLPVDYYILEATIPKFTKGELLIDVKEGIDKIPLTSTVDLTVDLYPTGLTIVTLVVVEVLKEKGATINIFGFNPDNGTYYYQGTF